ncbi:MAG: hypothetical protein F4W90_08410 [Gammaproteobacteria bacterium]|nr:hypothetical protein [Gammaproteobacteria bacterium]
MTWQNHCRAATVLLLITCNLTFWCFALLVIVMLRTLQLQSILYLDKCAAACYRAAVRFDDLLLKRISKVDWLVNSADLRREQTYVMIANHVSWTDVFLLQSAVVHNGPIIKFLTKKQLLYVPIFAMIVFAFKFPYVNRKRKSAQNNSERRNEDLERVKRACAVLRSSPAAMLTFVEGTRFTVEKHATLASSYRHLLPPRLGGFSVLLSSLQDFKPPILDATLCYPKNATFWQFIGGAIQHVQVRIDMYEWEPANMDDAGVWLERTWEQKDQRLTDYYRNEAQIEGTDSHEQA